MDAEKISIAFAEWLYANRWFNFEGGKWHYTFEHGTSMNRNTYNKHYVKTTAELFSDFYTEQLVQQK